MNVAISEAHHTQLFSAEPTQYGLLKARLVWECVLKALFSTGIKNVEVALAGVAQ